MDNQIAPPPDTGTLPVANASDEPKLLNAQEIPTIQTSNTNTKTIIIAVILFGALQIVISVLALINNIKILSLPGGNTPTIFLSVILAVSMILVATGLLLRREMARKIYIFVTCIFFIFALYNSYKYLSAVPKIDPWEQSQTAKVNQQITRIQNDHSMSTNTKAEIIQGLNYSHNQQVELDNKAKQNTLGVIAEYLIPCLPLLFLMRKNFKAVFS